MLRKVEDKKNNNGDTRLKTYTYSLIGKDLYVYRKKDSETHKNMHSLVGVFLRDANEEEFDSCTVLQSFKLYSKPNTIR